MPNKLSIGNDTITGNIDRVSYRVNRGEGENKIFIGTSVISVNKGTDFIVLSASRVNRIINELNARYTVTMFDIMVMLILNLHLDYGYIKRMEILE